MEGQGRNSRAREPRFGTTKRRSNRMTPLDLESFRIETGLGGHRKGRARQTITAQADGEGLAL